MWVIAFERIDLERMLVEVVAYRLEDIDAYDLHILLVEYFFLKLRN